MPLIAVEELIGLSGVEHNAEKELDKKLLSLEIHERSRSKQPSHQITNAILRQTMQPVTEVKLYKVANIGVTSEQFYSQTSQDSKAALQAAGKKKTLVGSEYSKYFLMKDEERIPIKEANQMARKEIAEEFMLDGQRLSEQMGNIHQIVAVNRRSNNISGTRHAEEKRRRFISESNTHKNRVIANPIHYTSTLEDHSDTEIAQWALNHTVRLPKKEIEKDLFNLEASYVADEEPATDSSEEEVEDASGKKKKEKKFYKRGDEFNILDMDVKGKLEKDLAKLDKNLTKDLMKRMQQRDARSNASAYNRQGRKAVTYFGLPNASGAENADDTQAEGGAKAALPVFGGKNRRKSSVSTTLREAQFRLENLRRQSAAVNLHNKSAVPSQPAAAKERAQSPPRAAAAPAVLAGQHAVSAPPPSAPSSAQKTHRSPRAQKHLVSAASPAAPQSRASTAASSPVDKAPTAQENAVKEQRSVTPSRTGTAEIPSLASPDLEGDEDNDENDEEMARLFFADDGDGPDDAASAQGQSNQETDQDIADRARRSAIVMRVLDELRKVRENANKTASVDFTYAVDEKLASMPTNTQEPGTLYFVSPIHTVMKKATISGEASNLRPMPYREREVKSNLKLGSHEVRVKNEEVIRQLNDKEIYPDMTAALRKIDQTSTAVMVTKRARNAIAKDLVVVKEVCHTVSKHCIRETKHLVQVCKRATRDKEQKSNDFVQALEERKFTLTEKLENRRRQLAEFDESQMQFIDRTIDPSELRVAHVARKAVTEEKKENEDADLCTTRTVSFITQQSHTNRSNGPVSANKKNVGLSSPRAVQKTKNDFKLLYDYDAYFRALTKNNEKNTRKREEERVLSKKWFIQLLKKVKIYKISVSYARVPESLMLLLSAIKKLIAMGIGFSRTSVWLLVDKTIKPDECKSNLVYTALQSIFDAVNVSPEEIYRRWQVREIDVAPQLLVNVRRARKERRLKVRHALLAKAQSKERTASRLKNKVIRAFMSSIKEDQVDGGQAIKLRADSNLDYLTETEDINLASVSSNFIDTSPKRFRSKTESFDFSVQSEDYLTEKSKDSCASEHEDEFNNADVDAWLT